MSPSICVSLLALLLIVQGAMGWDNPFEGYPKYSYYVGVNTGFNSHYYSGSVDNSLPDSPSNPSWHSHYYQPEPEFPTEEYNNIPEKALDDSLCYLLENKDFRTLKTKLREKNFRRKDIKKIISNVKKINKADFKQGLLNLGHGAYDDLSEAGKNLYCKLLNNMPDTYTTCGYKNLIKVLTDKCETPLDNTVAPTTAPTTQAPTTTTPTTQPPTTTPTTKTPTTQAPTTTTTTTQAPTSTSQAPEPIPTIDCNDVSTIRSLAVTTRIVGGVAAQQGEYDSFASLKVDNSANPVCGATIINSCTIVTAAHCVDGLTADRVTVQVGDHTTANTPQAVNVQSITVHEGYDSTRVVNDIAILKIDPIDFNAIPDTAPACQATTDLALDGQDCTVVGVGTTSYGGRQPDDYLLQEVTVPTFDGTTCAQDSNTLVQMSDQNNQICAGEDGKDSCQGDSGGPLYCQQDGQQVLTGIVSYGINCGQPGYPGVYVKVSEYADWIDQNKCN